MNHTILAEYDISGNAGTMHKVYHELKKFLNQKFGDSEIVFEANEIIYFHQPDLDYFLPNSDLGFNLYNLQLILKKLNIPNFFCRVISNIPNINKYLASANSALALDDEPIIGITSHYYSVCSFLKTEVTYTETDTNWPFIVLSRQARFHRTYFMSKLFNASLEKQGLVAFNNIPFVHTRNEGEKNNHSTANDSPCIFLSTTPFTYNNTELFIKSKENQQIYNSFSNSVSMYRNFDENTDFSNKTIATEFNTSPVQKSLVYVALETTVTHPEVFLSTISFKGIFHKRPFIILGVPGTVAYLKSLGFKTFSDFWDESYDSENCFETRVDKIIKILEFVSNLTRAELSELHKQMQQILEYNHHYLFNDFLKKEKSNLYMM